MGKPVSSGRRSSVVTQGGAAVSRMSIDPSDSERLISPAPSFQAVWHPELRPSLFARFLHVLVLGSPLGVVAAIYMGDPFVLVACLFFSLLLFRQGVHHVVGKAVLPAQLIAKSSWWCSRRLLNHAGLEESLIGPAGLRELEERKEQLIHTLGGQAVSVRTPDGVLLDAAHFCLDDPSGPTVIYFNANMQLLQAESATGLIQMYQQQGVNVMLFNYRGIGLSAGSVTCEGVVVDADSIYQYVHDRLRVPDNKIILHGRSLGGGVALQLARLHPRLHLCSERSFSSLRQVIKTVLLKLCGAYVSKQMLDSGAMEMISGDSCKRRCSLMLRRQTVSMLMCLVGWIGWKFEGGAQVYRKLQSTKWLLFHPHDNIVPFEASLYSAVDPDNSKPDWAYQMQGDVDGHNRPLTLIERQWHMRMVHQAVGDKSLVESSVADDGASMGNYTYGSI